MAGAGVQSFELTPASSRASRRTMPPDGADDEHIVDPRLHRRTLLKLDCLLLPLLALLFLFNALDKANIGNAESAHFTADIGLERSDINTATALFFAFFVALQPVGAALGRRYGMVAWVPSCMFLWGLATALHMFVQHRWQLYTLRIIIGCLEAGFYPATVTYLSLFYTRFEFGRRLSLFYGQAAVGGALGGVISYLVFSRFGATAHGARSGSTWRPWQVLFLLEGTLTMVVALFAYFWLPHSAKTAWFLSPQEREYASTRILLDRDAQTVSPVYPQEEEHDEDNDAEESRRLLNPNKARRRSRDRASLDDRGVTPQDILSAIFNTKIWHILAFNILSSIPVYAFSVFLPLVLAPLTKKSNTALINLLTAPPHVCGAIVLYFFARYSDMHRIRLVPVLYGLVIVVAGLTAVVILPVAWAIPRYLALNVLLSGTYVASPLTVAWISGNTPSPGKRALLLGINGWGNLAGVIAAALFRPSYADSGYVIPFWWTLICVVLSGIGVVFFLRRLRAENAARKRILSAWSEEAVELERLMGTGPLFQEHRWTKKIAGAGRDAKFDWVSNWLENAIQGGREGDERITFVYGL
ncbi:major facilitator superfamily domain-containing protein [Ampelomyces quisqualis]|uniref:Major facilitator superfamily domain-containing protein n=1 Tax=Ampelomyces quisqualis TaxID=50730 RepID=A0A6A5QWF1_AMPQU|nr:major facilitator superfamily domain-containing protein [Ampelomyces quisqualis]